MQFIHTPGHCPGQVCIGLGDILLSADHILPTITPHQRPKHYAQHRLGALLRLAGQGPHPWTGSIWRIGGHEQPFREINKRIDEIRRAICASSDKILNIVQQADGPISVDEISTRLYTRVKGFHVLLAVQEVGAMWSISTITGSWPSPTWRPSSAKSIRPCSTVWRNKAPRSAPAGWRATALRSGRTGPVEMGPMFPGIGRVKWLHTL